ncbi:hypothetical protein BDV96DRAFT_663356 [Lophiotrema nucula]|uniref:Uncharacterized protein n=1 Tax=Lophiotrema nucula TaxID=690887 RepID=A0A6A5ZSU5_9PLEO|nr:hypothetical protein BDV96DRAFT_663356 [Lophiotrema nucula]
MSQSQEQTDIARRHSWQPIQDGDQAHAMDTEDFNGDGTQEGSGSAAEQQEDSSLNQAQLDECDFDIDDQQSVLQDWQPPAVGNSMQLHRPRPVQPSHQQHYQLPAPAVVPGLLFSNDQDAAHTYRRRVTELPKLAHSHDLTIKAVEQNREQHIADMIAAIYDLSNVLDKPNGRECKMFANNPSLTEFVEPYIIEAACRSVFDLLLDRCYNGFRGQMKDNHARRPASGREADRDAFCSTRLYNVVEVLRTSKCACRDILYEDYKITLLVNHPLYFLKKKNECRRNNEHKRNVNMKAKAALAAAERHEGSPQTLAVAQPADRLQIGNDPHSAATPLVRDLNDGSDSNQPNPGIPSPLSQQGLTNPWQDQHFQQLTDTELWVDGNPAPPDFGYSGSVPTDQHQHQTHHKIVADVYVIDPSLEAFIRDLPDPEQTSTGEKRRSASPDANAERPAKVTKVENHQQQNKSISLATTLGEDSNPLL